MLSSLALFDWLLFLSAVPSLPSSLRLEAQSCLLTPPSCLFLDGLQVCSVYDDSASAPALCFLFHRQCPDSSLVVCCLNDCGKPVTLSTIHAALLTTAVQYSRSPGLEPSRAKGKAAPTSHSLCDFGETNITGSQLSLCKSGWVTESAAPQCSG